MDTHPFHYRHTQPGIFILLVLTGALLMTGLGAYWSSWSWFLWPFVFLLAAVGYLFHSLTTEIDGSNLACWFGPGLIRRRFNLSDIASAQPVRNKWYYGFGIRYTPHGWLFNVSGLSAVELVFTDGDRFRIGTDRPEELAEAIAKAKIEVNPEE